VGVQAVGLFRRKSTDESYLDWTPSSGNCKEQRLSRAEAAAADRPDGVVPLLFNLYLDCDESQYAKVNSLVSDTITQRRLCSSSSASGGLPEEVRTRSARRRS
jgi:hypothetical protein